MASDAKTNSLLDFDRKAKRRGFEFIIGIDEVGRGPLAGPVVAAAVHVKDSDLNSKIADSKKLSPSQRENAFCEICDKAWVGVGIISETLIDQINILRAAQLAMENAVRDLMAKIQKHSFFYNSLQHQVLLLVDGPIFETELPFTFEVIIDGDRLSFSIACASIVAKVLRDRMLLVYDHIYPQYGFKQHKGYPTAQHRDAIRRLGLIDIHRKTFRLKR